MAKAKPNKESNVAKANGDQVNDVPELTEGSPELTEVNETIETADAATDVETAEKTEGVPMGIWRVEVECPTPLAHNPTEVMAFDVDQAWQVFLAKNGISGTEHKRTITAIETAAATE